MLNVGTLRLQGLLELKLIDISLQIAVVQSNGERAIDCHADRDSCGRIVMSQSSLTFANDTQQ